MTTPTQRSSDPSAAPQRTDLTRRSLLGGGSLSTVGVLAACSALPGLPGGGGTDQDDTSDGSGRSSDAGGSDGAEEGATSPITADDWTKPLDLDAVSFDIAAADKRYSPMVGERKREDRYGTWFVPVFPPDGELATTQPVVAQDASDAGREAAPAALGVLASTIATILDSPLALEEDNARSGEVSPELVQDLALDGGDPHSWDQVFEDIPLNGTGIGEDGAPEFYGFEPTAYTEGHPRIHLLEHALHVEPARSGQVEGTLLTAAVRGVISVHSEQLGDTWLEREAQLCLGVGEGPDQGRILLACAVSAGVPVYVEDPAQIPAVELAAKTPEAWDTQELAGLSVRVPDELGQAQQIEHAWLWGSGTRDQRAATFTHILLPPPTPYSVPTADVVARFEVPGADLVLALIDRDEESDTSRIIVRIHRGEESWRLQLFQQPNDTAAQIVHQLVAGIQASA